MTAHDPIYRATVYEDEARTTVLTPAASAPHSDEFKVATAKGVTGFKPYMGFPEGRKGSIDPKNKGTDTGQIRFPILDARVDAVTSDLERWFSAFIGDADGQPQVGGNPILVEESLDGGSSWSDYFTGRVLSPKSDGRLVMTLTVRDLKEDLKVPTFQGGPHHSLSWAHGSPLLPIGIPFSWGGVDQVQKIPSTFQAQTAADRLEIDVANLPEDLLGRLIVTKALREEASAPKESVIDLNEGLGATPSGVRVRAEITSGTNSGSTGIYHLLGGFAEGIFAGMLGGIVTEETENGQRRVTSIGIEEVDSSHPDHLPLPSDGDDVEFYLESGEEPTEDAPIFIEEEHPVTVAKALLDGKFDTLKSDGSVLRTVSYRDPDNLESDTSLGTFRGLIQEPVDDKWAWMQEHLFQAYGFGAYLDDSGDVVFVDLRTPEKSEATGVPTITQSMVALGETPEWEHNRGEAVTRVEFTYYRDEIQEVEDLSEEGEFPDVPPGLIEATDVPFTVLDIGDPSLSPQPHEIDAVGYRYTSDERQRSSALRSRLEKVAEDYRVPFARGPEFLRIALRRSDSTVQGIVEGDVLEVDADVYPDPQTHKRGGARAMKATEVTRRKNVIEVRLLDLYSTAQASEPTFPSAPSATQADDLSWTIEQAISASSDGPAVVEYAITDQSVGSRPADDSDKWGTMGRKHSGASIEPSVEGIGNENRVWIRARTLAGDLVPSDWRYPSDDSLQDYVDTGTIAAVSSLALQSKDSARAEWTWSPANDDLRVRVTVTNTTQGTEHVQKVLGTGADGYEVRGTVAGEDYEIEVVQVDELGAVGSAATGTWTADASNVPTPPRPRGLDVISFTEGEGIRDHLGEAIYVFPADPSIPLVLQVAPDDGTGSPDTGSIIEEKIDLGMGVYIFDATGKGSGTDFVYGATVWYRLVHRAGGWNDSDPTAWQSDVLQFPPRSFPPRPPNPDFSADIQVDDSTGDVDLVVSSDQGEAIRYWTSTSGFPAIDSGSGTAASLNSDGDVTVNSIMSLAKGDRAYVTVAVFGDDPPCDPSSSVTCLSLAVGKVSELRQADPDASDVGLPPRTTFTRKSSSATSITYTVDAIAGEGGTSSLEAQHRVNGPGTTQGTYSAWASVPYDVTISRHYRELKELEARSRDTGLPGNPVGQENVRGVAAILEFVGSGGGIDPGVDLDDGTGIFRKPGGASDPDDGRTIPRDSGGPTLDRAFAKPSSGDPDDLDAIPDGGTYDRIDRAYTGGNQRPEKVRDTSGARDVDGGEVFAKPAAGDPDDARSVPYQSGTPVDDLEPKEANADETVQHPQDSDWINQFARPSSLADTTDFTEKIRHQGLVRGKLLDGGSVSGSVGLNFRADGSFGGNTYKITLTGDTTLTLSVGVGPADWVPVSVLIVVVQDGTGGHNLTWDTVSNSQILTPSGGDPAFDTSANAINLFSATLFEVDGSQSPDLERWLLNAVGTGYTAVP